MSELVIAGNTSGSVTVRAPDIAGDTVINLPAKSMDLTPSFGGSQDWVDVKSSRALGTLYTNETDKPIMCIVTALTSATGGYIDSAVNGVGIGTSTQGYTSGAITSISFIVPAGKSYTVTGTSISSISKWFEFR